MVNTRAPGALWVIRSHSATEQSSNQFSISTSSSLSLLSLSLLLSIPLQFQKQKDQNHSRSCRWSVKGETQFVPFPFPQSPNLVPLFLFSIPLLDTHLACFFFSSSALIHYRETCSVYQIHLLSSQSMANRLRPQGEAEQECHQIPIVSFSLLTIQF